MNQPSRQQRIFAAEAKLKAAHDQHTALVEERDHYIFLREHHKALAHIYYELFQDAEPESTRRAELHHHYLSELQHALEAGQGAIFTQENIQAVQMKIRTSYQAREEARQHRK